MSIVYTDKETYEGYVISRFGVEFFLGYGDMVQKCTLIAQALVE